MTDAAESRAAGAPNRRAGPTRVRWARCLVPAVCITLACRHRAAEPPPPARDQPRQESTVGAEFLRDTTIGAVPPARARSFDLQKPPDRDSLRALIRSERARWRAGKPRDYRFIARSSCFCPGPRGWLLVEAREGEPLRAWDAAGKPAVERDWDTFTIDKLFDDLERSAGRDGSIRVAFDQRYHFPAYIGGSGRMPDSWWIIEVRALRPLPSR